MIGRIAFALCASLLLTAASVPQTKSPHQAKLLVDVAYPLRSDGRIIIARYRENQPITIYLPDAASGKIPVVILITGGHFLTSMSVFFGCGHHMSLSQT